MILFFKTAPFPKTMALPTNQIFLKLEKCSKYAEVNAIFFYNASSAKLETKNNHAVAGRVVCFSTKQAGILRIMTGAS